MMCFLVAIALAYYLRETADKVTSSGETQSVNHQSANQESKDMMQLFNKNGKLVEDPVCVHNSCIRRGLYNEDLIVK